jgi:menaquinone-dependent protoporphyrinogen IX oxidase
MAGNAGAVFGAPINGVRWPPEALGFVESHAAELKKIPTAFYLLSVMLGGSTREGLRKRVPSFIAPATDKVRPIKLGIFGGRMA